MPTIEDVISGLCLAQTEKLKGVDEEVRFVLRIRKKWSRVGRKGIER